MVESILKPSAKLAQGYETSRFVTTDKRVFQRFVVSERVDTRVTRELNSAKRDLKKIGGAT